MDGKSLRRSKRWSSRFKNQEEDDLSIVDQKEPAATSQLTKTELWHQSRCVPSTLQLSGFPNEHMGKECIYKCLDPYVILSNC